MSKLLIIGSGLGGIALAIHLQSSGIPTILLEKNNEPGGRASVYKNKGFIFDKGPTVITDPSLIEELFNLSNKRLSKYIKLIPVKPFYRLCWEDGKIFNYDNKKSNIKSQILNFNFDDVGGYEKFLLYSEFVFKKGYLKLSTVPFYSVYDIIYHIPDLIKIKIWKNTYNVVSKFIKNKNLRQVFSFHSLLIGGNPFTIPSIYTLIYGLEQEWGIWFVIGGINVLIKILIKLFLEIGGIIKYNYKIEKLIIKNNNINSIKLSNDKYIKVIAIASNADIIYTYEKLLINNNKNINILKKKKMSNSVFLIYLGLNYYHNHLAHHTICFGSNYKKIINKIFNCNILSKNFSIYLHSPCVTDSSLAPPNCGTHYILIPVPNLGIANLNWNKIKFKLFNKIIDYLEKYYIPGLRNQLIISKIFTPIDFLKKYNSYLGSAFSIKPILKQSSFFRPYNYDNKINNLYFVGAGTQPGAGIPGVITSAKITSKLILESFL